MMKKESLRIQQQATLNELFKEYNPLDFIMVYLDDYEYGIHDLRYFCCLIPEKNICKFLENSNWDCDFFIRELSGFSIIGDGEDTKYYRSGDYSGIAPLVIHRDFDKIYPDYIEISEEFRLFHNLYHDQKSNEYYKYDKAGDTEKIATVSNNQVKIRLKEILEFAGVKNMRFVWLFDCRKFSKFMLEDLELQDSRKNYKKRDAIYTYDIYKHKDDLLNYKCSSCLCGKRIFDPLPQEKIDILLERKEAPKEYVKFITGMDKNGNKIEWPCGARNTLHRDSKFLAKVSFKKQVLGKYDNETSKYSVEDGSISCGALWHLTIDNYHKEDGLIYVYLGDLGVLPHKEQLYWKSYNVLPSEEISDIRWKRDFECEFTDSEQPDHAFIEKYRNLQKVCEKELGWQLLLPLNKNDEYLLKRIRIPSVNEQHIFDGLILDMAKILIDSINGGKIDVLLSEEQKKESKEFKGNKKILKLEKLLENCLLDNINKTRIEFLHDLQKVRSQGSAHRKSDKYKNLLNKFNKINDSLVDTATNILQKSISVLDFFIKAIPSIKTYQEKLKTQNKC